MALLLIATSALTGLWVSPALGHPGGSSAVSTPVEPIDVSLNKAVSGVWTTPFSEGGLFNTKPPPQTVAESKMKPPAVSIAVLPDARILYWGGLEDLEDGNAPVAL